MKLYIIQHGKAVSAEVDPQRPLSEDGCRDVQKVGGFIRKQNMCVDCIWHSGKKRAAQTAEIIATCVPSHKGCIERAGLKPNDNAAALKEEILATDRDIMIVSHMPFVSRLASLLSAGDESTGIIAFKQGGAVCLERLEQDQWQIDWFVTPELL